MILKVSTATMSFEQVVLIVRNVCRSCIWFSFFIYIARGHLASHLWQMAFSLWLKVTLSLRKLAVCWAFP